MRSTDRLKNSLAAASGLASADASTRLLAFVEIRGEATFDENSESTIGLTPAQCATCIEQLVAAKQLHRSAGPTHCYVTAERFRRLKAKFLRRTQKELERRRPASRIPLAIILAAMSHDASEGILESLLSDLVAKREIIRRGDRIGLTSGPELSQKQRLFLVKILSEFQSTGRQPPTDKELAERHQLSSKELEPLIQVGIDDGKLLRLSPQMAVDRAAIEALRQSLADYFQSRRTAKVTELREQWGITRKHAIPIFEFFDEHQLTIRAGDLRTAGPRLQIPFDDAHT